MMDGAGTSRSTFSNNSQVEQEEAQANSGDERAIAMLKGFKATVNG